MAEAQKQAELPLEPENEEVEVDLQETGSNVEIVDDPQEPVATEETGEDDNKLDGYSKKVRDRIEKMTWKVRTCYYVTLLCIAFYIKNIIELEMTGTSTQCTIGHMVKVII